jgi:hypothetical protein
VAAHEQRIERLLAKIRALQDAQLPLRIKKEKCVS